MEDYNLEKEESLVCTMWIITPLNYVQHWASCTPSEAPSDPTGVPYLHEQLGLFSRPLLCTESGTGSGFINALKGVLCSRHNEAHQALQSRLYLLSALYTRP